MSNWRWWTAADWSCFLLCFRVLIWSRNNVILKASSELWEDCRRDREEHFWVMRNQRKWKEMGAKSSEQAEANEIDDIACGWRQPRTAQPRAGGIPHRWVLPAYQSFSEQTADKGSWWETSATQGWLPVHQQCYLSSIPTKMIDHPWC